MCTNVWEHARTENPVYICGQFYPKEKRLVFTLVDTGIGFKKPINEVDKNVTTADAAIKWALDGKTSRKTGIGGSGLKGLFDYCKNQSAELHIYTDGCYWECNGKSINSKNFQTPYIPCTIIHVLFNL